MSARRSLPFALALGLLISAPATAGRKQAKAPPPPPPVEEAAAPDAEARTAAFADYEAQVATGQKARAADALVALLQTPEHQPFHGEAYARLAVLLHELDLPYGALVAAANALRLDPEAEWSTGLVERAFELADQVGDPAILEPVFAENVGAAVDRTVRSRMAYLAARENLRKGNYSLSLALLKLVIRESPVFADAKMLEAVVLNQQNRPGDALAPLLAALEVAKDQGRDLRFIDAVKLNLARSYYAAGNYPRAIEYYAQVSREGDFFLEALFERAWAHFRIDDMGGVVGLLHTQDSPFFVDHYYPEGDLLRVYSLFMLCKFPAASVEIDDFRARYEPLHRTVGGAVAGLSAEEAFSVVRSYIAGEGPGPLPVAMLRPWRHEARFNAAVDAVSHAEDEAVRLRNVSANPFAAEASRWVAARRQELVRAEGQRVLDRLSTQMAELGSMLTSAEISKLDMLQMETRLYQQASFTGELSGAERQVVRPERIPRDHVWWPWEGEYWADELGWYRVRAIPECPEGLRTSNEE